MCGTRESLRVRNRAGGDGGGTTNWGSNSNTCQEGAPWAPQKWNGTDTGAGTVREWSEAVVIPRGIGMTLNPREPPPASILPSLLSPCLTQTHLRDPPALACPGAAAPCSRLTPTAQAHSEGRAPAPATAQSQLEEPHPKRHPSAPGILLKASETLPLHALGTHQVCTGCFPTPTPPRRS